MDLSGKMLARAKEKRRAPVLVRARVEKFLFGEGSFDAVVASSVLCYVDEFDEASAEMARVAQPGGVVAFSMEKAAKKTTSLRIMPPGAWFRKLEDIEKTLAEARLEVIYKEEHPGYVQFGTLRVPFITYVAKKAARKKA